MRRKNELVTGSIYHIISRSIAGYRIFNNPSDYDRMVGTVIYYQQEKPECKLSHFIYQRNNQHISLANSIEVAENNKIAEIIAYCVMPTHIHLVLRQCKTNGISTMISKCLNSYTKYFNLKHKRNGPLWESRFKNVLVETDEQLIHLTRYLHLNPVTAFLIDKPELWTASSYNEYLSKSQNDQKTICAYKDILEIRPNEYKKFVDDRIDYQRELAKIKSLVLEE